MNTVNNKRTQETDRAIIEAVFSMMTIEKRPLSRITVREVCERAHIHRSTFYAHYQDVYDLVEKVEQAMSVGLTESFLKKLEEGACAEECFMNLFEFIAEYKAFYKMYLTELHNTGVIALATELYQEKINKLDYKPLGFKNREEFRYHHQFYLYGVTGLIRLWLQNDCKESPEEIARILLRQHVFEELIASMGSVKKEE